MGSMVSESFPGEEFDFEMESGVRRNDSSGTLLSVGILRRSNDLGDFSLAHLGDSFVPGFNDLSDSQLELELLSSVP